MSLIEYIAIEKAPFIFPVEAFVTMSIRTCNEEADARMGQVELDSPRRQEG
jgi:hypothetical protein